MFAILFIYAFAALAGVASHPSADAATPFSSLLTRQSESESLISPSDLPEQCLEQCMPMVDSLNKCDTNSNFECSCNDTVKSEIQSCFACLVDLAPTLASQLDETEGLYDDECAAKKKSGTGTGANSASPSLVPIAVSGATKNHSSGDDDDDDSSSNSATTTNVHSFFMINTLIGAFLLFVL